MILAGGQAHIYIYIHTLTFTHTHIHTHSLTMSRSSILLPAVIISATIGLSSYLLLNKSPSVLPNHIASPRTLLPSLTEEEISKLPYPPTFFPEGRGVETPHGTIRVYEFGPVEGKKVLLVHGISTPCCVYRDLAWHLVEKGGCRVMLFGIWKIVPFNYCRAGS